MFYKLCELLGYTHLLQSIKLPRSEAIVFGHDLIWKFMMVRLSLPYHPTLPNYCPKPIRDIWDALVQKEGRKEWGKEAYAQEEGNGWGGEGGDHPERKKNKAREKRLRKEKALSATLKAGGIPSASKLHSLSDSSPSGPGEDVSTSSTGEGQESERETESESVGREKPDDQESEQDIQEDDLSYYNYYGEQAQLAFEDSGNNHDASQDSGMGLRDPPRYTVPDPRQVKQYSLFGASPLTSPREAVYSTSPPPPAWATKSSPRASVAASAGRSGGPTSSSIDTTSWEEAGR
jgi:hypothetical protein